MGWFSSKKRGDDRTPSDADQPQDEPPTDLPATPHETCLSDPHMQAAFERSNLPRGAWDWGAGFLDDYFANVPGVRPRFIEEVSVVEFFRKPDGSSMGTDTMLLGVLKVGLILTSERDFKEFVYSDSATAAFVADDLVHGRGRGECAIQAVSSGSAPVFRIGWEWDRKGDAHEQFDAAAAERDRILNTMCRGLQLSR